MENALNDFKDIGVQPPGREWFYRMPGGEVLRAPLLSTLTRDIRSRWPPDSLFPGDLEAEVRAFMCDYMPDGFCKKRGRYPRLLLSRVMDFTHFLGRSLHRASTPGGPPILVSPEEAEARAAICASCPYNVKAFCSPCLGLSTALGGLIPAGRRSATDREIGACSLCGCMLSVKVNFNRDLLKSEIPHKEKPYPPHCWMNDEPKSETENPDGRSPANVS